MHSKQRAFTLIELMVVVAIVAILSSIALPWYGAYVQRGNRGDAISPMQSILDAEERFYTDNVTYTTDLTDLGLSSSSYTTTNGHYVIIARACEDSSGSAMALTQCIELYATAQGSQADDGDLVVNTLGRQDRILSDGTVKEWTGI